MYLTLSDIRKFLKGPSLTSFAKRASNMRTAKVLIKYYYLVVPYAAFLYATNTIANRENFDPLWPLVWTQWLSIPYIDVVLFLKVGFIAAGLLGVFFYKKRWVRVLIFLAIWQIHALESSFSFINHQWYLWLYTSCIFIFLPDIWNRIASIEENRKFLLAIWTAQAIGLLTYTMAGLWKFIFAFHQWSIGEVHGLAVSAFSYQVANWVPRLQAEAVLAPYIIAYPEISWPFYVTLHFIQIFAIWAMVRTSLQKIWGVLLFTFHVATLLTMGISFHPLAILIIVLYLNTPFTPDDMSVRRIIRDLPILGYLITKFRAT